MSCTAENGTHSHHFNVQSAITVIETAGVLYFACSLSLNLFRCGHPYLLCFHSFLFFSVWHFYAASIPESICVRPLRVYHALKSISSAPASSAPTAFCAHLILASLRILLPRTPIVTSHHTNMSMHFDVVGYASRSPALVFTLAT
jgi:hypothetical protein